MRVEFSELVTSINGNVGGGHISTRLSRGYLHRRRRRQRSRRPVQGGSQAYLFQEVARGWEQVRAIPPVVLVWKRVGLGAGLNAFAAYMRDNLGPLSKTRRWGDWSIWPESQRQQLLNTVWQADVTAPPRLTIAINTDQTPIFALRNDFSLYGVAITILQDYLAVSSRRQVFITDYGRMRRANTRRPFGRFVFEDAIRRGENYRLSASLVYKNIHLEEDDPRAWFSFSSVNGPFAVPA